MPKLTVGAQMPDFTFDTPFEKNCILSQTAKMVAGKTALLFLRYYGCTLCQYDIHQYIIQYDKIAATGGQLLIVLQSAPAKLAADLQKQSLPFSFICDPKQELYKMFEIEPAESMAKMADLKTLGKIAKATAKGFKHGDYEGNELQLPACFIIDPSLKLHYIHYGVSAGDVPEPEQLAELLQQ